MGPERYSIGVISDTHGFLPSSVFAVFEGVDQILHAGDYGETTLLDRLNALAPVTAVSGNMDGVPTARCPLTRQIETPLGRIALTHGHVAHASAQSPASLAGFFVSFAPDIAIFGHTHRPYLGTHDGVTLFNPGSASQGRGEAGASVGLIVGGEGVPARLEHVFLEQCRQRHREDA